MAKKNVSHGKNKYGLLYPHMGSRNKGVIEEPHHNTYDIEFWGPDGMHSSFYIGALNAIIEMGKFLQKDVTQV